MNVFRKVKSKLYKSEKDKETSDENSEALGSVPSVTGTPVPPETPSKPLVPVVSQSRSAATPPRSLPHKMSSAQTSLNESFSFPPSPGAGKGWSKMRMAPGKSFPPGAKLLSSKGVVVIGKGTEQKSSGVRPPLQKVDSTPSRLSLSPLRRGSSKMNSESLSQGDSGDLLRQNSLPRSPSVNSKLVLFTKPPGKRIDQPVILSRRNSQLLAENIEFHLAPERPSPNPPTKLGGTLNSIVAPKLLSGMKKLVHPPPVKRIPSPVKTNLVEEKIVNLDSFSSSSSIVLETGSPLTVQKEEKDSTTEMSISLSSGGENTGTVIPVPSVSVSPRLESHVRQDSPRVRSPSSHSVSKPPSSAFLDKTGDVSVPLPDSNQRPSQFVQTHGVTKEGRRKIVEQLSLLLSPHQYYGKIVKVKDIETVAQKNKLQPPDSLENRLYVATKDSDEARHFFPQLRLLEMDGIPGRNPKTPGAVETRITIHEAIFGKMFFASSELEANRLLQAKADSCFVTSGSHILFKNPSAVTPIAKLTIVWIPFSSPYSEPQCPVHHKEMQLFDPYSRKLICALCASKQPTVLSKLVVIPDVLTPHSRISIVESLNRQLENSRRTLHMWLSQHERVVRMSQSKKSAVTQQFDLLQTALESKKKEFMEACDAEFEFALSDIAKEILTSSEKIDVLVAANSHLESRSSLYSLQIATIAEGLEASRVFPSKLSRVPALPNSLMPKLDGVMSEVHALNPNALPAVEKSIASSELRPQRISGVVPFSQSALNCAPSLHSKWPKHQKMIVRQPECKKESRARDYGRSSSSPSTAPVAALGQQSSRSRSADPGTETCPKPFALPHSSGTAMFDYPIHNLFASAVRTVTVKKRFVQFSFQVVDYGDWVGLGVGVGTPIEAYASSAGNDLSHLWIAPYGAEGEVFTFRVTERRGQAELSVHDRRGKRIDDGHIPRWNPERPCYPQVTFGGKVGHVELSEMPHIVEV